MHRVLCAILLVSLLPIGSASELGPFNPETPTPTTMYVHLNDFQDAPINTQRPSDAYAQSQGIGLVQHSQGCFENPSGSLLAKAKHTTYGFSSPGYVQYDIDEGNKPRFHNERGISYDVRLDETPIVFRWYLETQLTSGDNEPNPNQIPAMLPQVSIQATLREGDDISVNKVAYNEGAIIAYGASTPAELAGPLTPENPHVTYVPHEGRHLYAFEFPLDIQQPVIHKDESFNLRVDVHIENPVCNDVAAGDYLMIDWIRTHTSPAYRPSFVWNIMNPLRIESLHPQLVGDDLVVHAHANSAWGNYDLLGDSYDGGAEPMLRIEGPSTPVNVPLVAYVNPHGDHNAHTQNVAYAWSWSSVEERAREGTYRVSLQIANDQETASASAVAEFEIGSDHRATTITGCQTEGCAIEVREKPVTKDTPAPLLLPALLAGLLLRRRGQ